NAATSQHGWSGPRYIALLPHRYGNCNNRKESNMEHAKLMVHRGATRVTRDELAAIQAPAATETWKPIKHAVLVDTIHEELRRRGIGIAREEYAVQRQHTMLFGVMVLHWMQTEEFAAALAFRHANDRSEAIK